MRELRLLDSAGRYVCKLTEEEADSFIASGRAKLHKRGRRAFVMLVSKLTVEEFDAGTGNGAGLRATYRETQAGHSLLQLKRAGSGGTLHKWDNDLTFRELRAGQMVSRTTRERIARIERERLEQMRRNQEAA